MFGIQIETTRTFYGENENRLRMYVIIDFLSDDLKHLSIYVRRYLNEMATEGIAEKDVSKNRNIRWSIARK